MYLKIIKLTLYGRNLAIMSSVVSQILIAQTLIKRKLKEPRSKINFKQSLDSFFQSTVAK